MVFAERIPRNAVKGVTSPRIAPPLPHKSLLADFELAAGELGLKLMPWQRLAARYLVGVGPRERWRYREVCIVVARQNGKTTLLLPRILMELKAGREVLHTAQNRAIPRETFDILADHVWEEEGVKVSKTNGLEKIRFPNGGRYTLVAPGSHVRGYHADLVIQDEIAQQKTDEVRKAMLPTTMARPNPQTIYITNAGTTESVVLNDLRDRRDDDDGLAYLEWSAAPDRAITDRAGWAEANPALGYVMPIENLEAAFRTQGAAGFETENLCRWVTSLRQKLVDERDWLLRRGTLETPLRPAMGIGVDPSGTRVSAAIAWRQSDGTLGLRIEGDWHADAIDIDRLGKDLAKHALKIGVPEVGYDKRTDENLARHFRKTRPLNSLAYANATENFVTRIRNETLRWDDADAITADLEWTGRESGEGGVYSAVRAQEDRSITSVQAAIRAVWLASYPALSAPKVM